MRIVICDDDVELANTVKASIIKNAPKKYYIEIMNPSELVFCIEENLLKADAVFIRCIFQEQDFFSKNIINKLNMVMPQVKVIYYSESADDIVDLFETNFEYYFLISQLEYRMPFVLSVLSSSKNADSIVEIVSNNKRFFIRHNQIKYIERIGRKVTVFLKDAATPKIETYQSLTSLSNRLGENFIRCHGSIVVNLAFVKMVKEVEVVLDDGVSLPCGRTYRDKVIERVR